MNHSKVEASRTRRVFSELRKDAKIVYSTYNANSATVATKPAFQP